MVEEPEYRSLPELREALTSDNPETRAPAYAAVTGADVDVSEALSSDPPEQTLVDEGVIPASSQEPGVQVQILDELEAIRKALEGGGN